MANDTPCHGDAYHPAEVGPSLIPTYRCDSCANSATNGGKCGGGTGGEE